MPGKGLLLTIISTILQYGILFLLYWFLYRMVKLMYRDLTAPVKELPIKFRSTVQLTVVNDGGISLGKDKFAFATELSLGRDNDNDVIIEDTYVSHHHAIIKKEGNQYIIEDLGSINHTYVNDTALMEKVCLQIGDIIKIGFVTFKFER